jgi:hypothetical protein
MFFRRSGERPTGDVSNCHPDGEHTLKATKHCDIMQIVLICNDIVTICKIFTSAVSLAL